MLGPPLLEPDEVRLLTQVGFIASAHADIDRVERIFGAILRVRPEQSTGFLGMAVGLLNASRAHEAVALLERAHLPAGEEADMVEAFLGLALQMDARTSDSTRVLRKVATSAGAQRTPPTPGAILAQRLLGEFTHGPENPASSPHDER